MQILLFYKWILETNTEVSWSQDILAARIYPHELKYFSDMVDKSLGEGGIECVLLSGGIIGIDLVPICEYFGIDPEHILKKNNE